MSKFEHNFPNEDHLQQAIAGLLKRMGHKRVQILQGTQELGKDIVFLSVGGMGEAVLNACVVKNTPISGVVDRSSGARTIFNQAQQALDTPYEVGDGTTLRVERVYIMTPFPIPPTTIKSVQGALERHGGALRFVSGPDLYDLFMTHWPDFFADESTAISQHLKATRDAFESDQSLVALATKYKLGALTPRKRIYVTPSLELTITSFEPYCNLAALLPSEDDLRRMVDDGGLLQAASQRVELVSELVRRLRSWGLVEQPLDRPGSSVHDLADHLVKMTEETHKRAIHGTSSVNDAESRMSIKVLVDSLASVKAQLVPIDKDISRCLGVLGELVESSVPIEARTLSDTRFQKANGLQDFILSTRSSFFSPIGRRVSTHSETILDDEWQSVLVVGPAGYGKSSFCRWNALRDAERYARGQSNCIPLYVSLYDVARRPLAGFVETFLSNLGRSALLPSLMVERCRSSQGRIRLYLDGLDEVPTELGRRGIVDLVRLGVAERPEIQAVFTSRDYVYGPYLTWLPRVNLSRFDPHQIDSLISRWFTDDGERASFKDQLKSANDLRELMSIPLLATLVILVFLRTKRLPESRTSLYRDCLDLFTGGWDVVKNISRPVRYGQTPKQSVLMDVATRTHLRREKTFGFQDLQDTLVGEALTRGGADHRELLEEILSDGLIVGSADAYQFAHLSFQEFLVAMSLHQEADRERVSEALRNFLFGDDWWREVLGFYIGLSGRPAELLKWLIWELDRYPGMERNSQVTQLIKFVKDAHPAVVWEDIVPPRFGGYGPRAGSQWERPLPRL